MRLSKLVPLSCLLAGMLGIGGARAVPTQRQAMDPFGPRWGITLEADRPAYVSGDQARVAYALWNLSGFDAFGRSLSSGGNGCEFRITVVDSARQIVWQPGSLQNGQFVGPGCVFGSRPIHLPSHTVLGNSASVPLVYQNAGGVGVPGDPLPPGLYRICVDVTFLGPYPSPGSSGPGPGYSACVPIRID